jgi:predicted RNase H-like HicB family nuclease
MATVPDLPGRMSEGETWQQAVSNIQDAILLAGEARNQGWSVPRA